MIACTEEHSEVTVVVIGPPPSQLGGMASVVAQQCSLDMGDRYHLELLPLTYSQVARESWIHRLSRHVGAIGRLRTTIRRTRAGIVHIHTCSGFSFYRSILDMIVAQRARSRVVLHIHGAAFDEFYDRAGTLGQELIGGSLSRADAVVALSANWRRKVLQMAPRARCRVIENAVGISDPTILSRGGSGPCRFMLLARMDDWKGVDDLLDACRLLRKTSHSFELVLAGPAGSAGDADTLNGKIADRQLERQVRYVGPVRGEDKLNLLRQTDVYVQPSHHEGMPISLLDALAFGLPVVATRVGAIPEVITDQREGILVNSHNPSELAQAMRVLIDDPASRCNMGKAGRELAASRFSLERLRGDLSNLYDSLLTPQTGHVSNTDDGRSTVAVART